MNEKKRRVVITGMGTYNPLGNDVESAWENVKRGQSGIGLITHFDATDFRTQIAGEVKGFDPVALFGRKAARRMSRVTQFALAAAAQALEDALERTWDREAILAYARENSWDTRLVLLRQTFELLVCKREGAS